MNQMVKERDSSRKDRRDLKQEATKIANAIQQSGYSREESRAIRAGLQQGMEMWLRQQNERSRELDKRSKKTRELLRHAESVKEPGNLSQPLQPPVSAQRSVLPWLLLSGSWILFAAYYFSR
ncbi:DUF2956 family protein [Cellvibrio polysaccharolyticus]|uniref:DUF2956 family protein n=1 Tax=Cellvibrio polysaccharolyticus TaxID=2082724 RepID=A0A928V6S9_9GAMM|nr:DUF2956 family protein [Cellvibrio polysaccharolyticus]MBE8717707.1 DUF2956 family protein [Cellvibrio polysaccharolyticus]